MTDARIPTRIDVVETSELPVEVDLAPNELKIWHDQRGEYLGDEDYAFADGFLEGAPEGTLRICRLVPVDEHESSLR